MTHHDDNGFYSVEGTPTDCVHLAITGLLEPEPDMVVSGINHGPNLGDDVIYSGTVAAAMEGRLGYRRLRSPQASFQPQYFETAARVAVWLVRWLQERPLPPDTILNVVMCLISLGSSWLDFRPPGSPSPQIRAGGRAVDPRGRTIYWVGPSGPEQDAGPGTDFHAIRAGFVSITPLHVDLTRDRALGPLAEWLRCAAP